MIPLCIETSIWIVLIRFSFFYCIISSKFNLEIIVNVTSSWTHPDHILTPSAHTFEQYVFFDIGTLLALKCVSFFFLPTAPASRDDFEPTSSCSCASCFARSISSISASCFRLSSRNLRTVLFFLTICTLSADQVLHQVFVTRRWIRYRYVRVSKLVFTHFFEPPSLSFDSFDSNVLMSLRKFSNPKTNRWDFIE